MKKKIFCVVLILVALLLVGITPALANILIPTNTSIGTWDEVNRIYTLNTDVYDTIQIDQNDLTLDGAGHTVTVTGSEGVLLSGRTGVTIKDLNVQGCWVGIHLYNSNSNTLAGNTASNNSETGIYMDWNCNYNTLAGNTASNNNYGIHLFRYCSSNTLAGNTASNNNYGIYLFRYCSSNTLTGNTASNNNCGIYLFTYCSSNTLAGNTASNNNYGIDLCNSNTNTLAGNTASNNNYGIYLENYSNTNTLAGNTASNNSIFGFLLSDSSSSNTLTGNTASNNYNGIGLTGYSSDNQIYNNNFIGNTVQAYVSPDSVDVFNLDKPTGGNYWSDWTAPDADNDGFVDDPYIFLHGGKDNLPWTRQDGWLGEEEGPICYNFQADPNPVAVKSEVTLTATVDDTETGHSNIASAEYSLDGGDWLLMVSVDGFDSPTEDVTATFYAPTAAGVYDLCVRGTDVLNNVGEPECILLVVYDPDAGFVTGGGWIDSPQGAYEADPSLTGKANFGFVSKYKKGASEPTGQTEFQFQVADLNFHSSSYEWLLVTGSNYAKFKGAGTINGGGAYKFMLWAGDGEPDTFRIKIWWEESGVENVVYDNGDDQAIGGGSIVIHTK